MDYVTFFVHYVTIFVVAQIGTYCAQGIVILRVKKFINVLTENMNNFFSTLYNFQSVTYIAHSYIKNSMVFSLLEFVKSLHRINN